MVRLFQYQPHTEPVSTRPETVTEDRWHQPWSEPVRVKIKPALAIALIASGLGWDPQPPIIPPQSIDKWQQPLSEPVRKKEDRIALRTRYPSIASAVHMGWFNPLSEPVPRAKSGLSAANQQAFAFNPFPIVPVQINIGWFNNLSDPVRRIRPTPTDQQFIPYQPIIPSFGWYGGLTDPIRNKPRITSFDPQNFVFQTTPAVAPFGWFNELSNPLKRTANTDLLLDNTTWV